MKHFDPMDNDSKNKNAMVKFRKYFNSNYSYYNDRYPLIFNEKNNNYSEME